MEPICVSYVIDNIWKEEFIYVDGVGVVDMWERICVPCHAQ